MHKLIIVLMLWAVAVVPALAQEKIYLPLIIRAYCVPAPEVIPMSDWKIIIPEQSLLPFVNFIAVRRDYAIIEIQLLSHS